MIADMKKGLITMVLTVLSAGSMMGGNLDGKWRLDYWPQERVAVSCPEKMEGVEYSTIEATVPGNVELDLVAAGLLPEPEIGSNYGLLRPYEGYQWRYSRSFTTPAFGEDDSVILEFEGIDTFADIYVNGNHIGSADNMLIEHEYDVTDVLNAEGADNTLEVFLRSSVIEGRKQLPPTFSNNWQRPETVFMRRAPHTYGWDIMPRIVSAGLWKGVDLRVDGPVHFEDVHWMTGRVDRKNRSADMMVDYMVSLPPEYQQDAVNVHVSLSRNGKVAFERTMPIAMYSERVRIHVEDIDLWWPRGYGEAALYDALVELVDARDGSIIDKDTQKVGIRTILLERDDISTKDKPGKFCFIVNGEPIFIHGSNWTPLDAFHSRDTKWMERAMELVTDLNCNMLRCWGGNVYESDEFYNLCSEQGVMIWQDFAMGCSFYPQSTAFQLKMEEEIYHVVKRLRRHTCVALWAGNNEDDCVIIDGNFSYYNPDPNRDRVTRVTIPNVLFDMDPTRPYLPSSPYVTPGLIANRAPGIDVPEAHLWGPRGYYKDSFYLETTRFFTFASEMGYHGMPNRESLEKMFTPENVYPWEEGSDFHWKEDWLYKSVREYAEWGYRPERNDLMINQVRSLFGEVPTDLDEFIYASQIVQAEAMKYFVECFRGGKFEPQTGLLWWNIRDGWPIISDAVVDWYFSPKRAYYYIRNSQQNVCALINDAVKGKHPLIVVNDTLEPACGTITVTDKESGKVLFKGPYKVGANGRAVIAKIPESKDRGLYEIRYTVGEREQSNHYLYGKAPFNLSDYKSWTKELGY